MYRPGDIIMYIIEDKLIIGIIEYYCKGRENKDTFLMERFYDTPPFSPYQARYYMNNNSVGQEVANYEIPVNTN